MGLEICVKGWGQPCKDLGKEQAAERIASAKARRGTKLGVFKGQEEG